MARFVSSIVDVATDFNDQVVEIGLFGRSNVGKSSLINALANSKIARTSKTPGRTQTINVYDFDRFRLLDLPGYGYAAVSHEKKSEFDQLIKQTISFRKNLFVVFQICDVRQTTKQDQLIHELLQKKFVNYYVLLNKIDLVSTNEYKKTISKLQKEWKLTAKNIIGISTIKKINISYLKSQISLLIK